MTSTSKIEFGSTNPVAPKVNRVRLTPDQSRILKDAFSRTESPSAQELEELSSQVAITAKWIRTWFSRQRMKKKKKPTERKRKKSKTATRGTSGTKAERRDSAVSSARREEIAAPGDGSDERVEHHSSSAPAPLASEHPGSVPSFATTDSFAPLGNENASLSGSPRSQYNYSYEHGLSGFTPVHQTPENYKNAHYFSPSNSHQYFGNTHYNQHDISGSSEPLSLPLHDCQNYMPVRGTTEDRWNFPAMIDQDEALNMAGQPSLLDFSSSPFYTPGRLSSNNNEAFLRAMSPANSSPIRPPLAPPFEETRPQLGSLQLDSYQPQSISHTEAFNFLEPSPFVSQLPDSPLINDFLPSVQHLPRPLDDRPFFVHEPTTPNAPDLISQRPQLAHERPGNLLEHALDSSISRDPFQAAMGLVLLSRLGFRWDYC